MYIQILEGLHKEEAEVLLNMKDKRLNKVYKGLSESVVKEAFGWNDNFVNQNKNRTFFTKNVDFIDKKKCLTLSRGFVYTDL